MQIKKNAPEFVGPSIPSPGGAVELSVLDRMTPSNYTSHLLLFQGMPAPAQAYAWLKSSLAESLNTFYPLAGRLRDKSCNGELEIVCNDEGALLQEAWMDCEFESFCLKSDFRPEFDLLAPQVDDAQGSLVLVQITYFQRGHVSLGFRLHHKTLDGISMNHFLNWWATLSRAKAGKGREGSDSNGELAMPMSMEAPPEGLRRSLLKPRKPPSPDFEHPEYMVLKQVKHETPSLEEAHCQDITSKIFPLMPADIDELRAAALDGSSPAFTRFEVLAAFIWRGVTYARNLAPTQDVRLGMAVDGRQRFEPPLPMTFFGNVTFYAIALCNVGKLLDNPLSFAANLVRAAIAKVDDAHMRSALDWLSMQDRNATVPVFPDVAISSWTRLGFYEMDFGWGKPSHVRVPEVANFMANILPSSLGPKHVEILLGLDVKQMSRFEHYVNQALKH